MSHFGPSTAHGMEGTRDRDLSASAHLYVVFKSSTNVSPTLELLPTTQLKRPSLSPPLHSRSVSQVSHMPFSVSAIKDEIWARPAAPQALPQVSKQSQSTPAVPPTRVALPLYIYPASGAWDLVFEAIVANPSVHFDVIVNPHNGPGGPVPDVNYITNISKLNSYSNVTSFGYVHTSWGGRSVEHITVDIDTYESWSAYKDADIHVGGIFFDEAPTTLSCLTYMREIYQHTKSTLTRGDTVWTNPGTVVDDRFFAVADLINTFEDSHENWQTMAHIPQQYRAKSTVMIHSYQGLPATLKEDTTAAAAAGYHSALFTTRPGYETLSSMWHELAHRTNTLET